MSKGDSILLKGGLIFDGKGSLLQGHAVLIEGKHIKAVAAVDQFQGFAGRGIDTNGQTLMPGLVDCHVHLCFTASGDPRRDLENQSPAGTTITALKNARSTLEGGVTSVRDCGGKDYLEFDVRDAIKRGEFPGPTIYASGKMICMTGGHGNRWGRVADGVEEVRKAVREQIHMGCDLVKIMATGGVMTPGVNPEDAHYSLEEMTIGVHEAHRFHRRTASHAQGTEGILNAVHAGIDSVEHGIFMNQACIDALLEADTYVVPTASAVRNIIANADNGVPAYAVEKSLKVVDRHRESIKAFYKAGGKIAMGTDAGTPFNRHGANAQELQYLTDWGITNSDALIMSTFNGADLMGFDDRGFIADGAVADLLVVDGNPLEDISMVANKHNHRLVVKDGIIVKI